MNPLPISRAARLALALAPLLLALAPNPGSAAALHVLRSVSSETLSALRVQDAPYSYRTAPDRAIAVQPARPYIHYRPRVKVRGVPETRIERQPPAYMRNRPQPASRASRLPRDECRLTSRPTSPGSSVRIYGAARDCR